MTWVLDLRLVILVMLIAGLIGGVCTLVYLKNISTECVREPFSYGANKYAEIYNADVFGNVIIIPEGNYKPLQLTFNEDKIQILK